MTDLPFEKKTDSQAEAKKKQLDESRLPKKQQV